MSIEGVDALRGECAALLGWLRDTRPDVCSPSRLPGWSIGDVLSRIDDRLAELGPEVAAHADLADRCDAGLAALAAMQVPVAGDRLRTFPGRGQHPTHLWADGLVHDLVVHRCFDLGVGDVLDASIGPALAWFTSAVPQVALAGLHQALRAPVAVCPAGHFLPLILWRVGTGIGVGDDPAGIAASGAVAGVDPIGLLRIGSGRSAWRDETVTVTGDTVLAAGVLDQLSVGRR